MQMRVGEQVLQIDSMQVQQSAVDEKQQPGQHMTEESRHDAASNERSSRC